MSEMVERVAKAICRESGHSWEHAGEGYRKTCEDFARAAIEAMRVPTDEMIDAAEAAVRPDSDNMQCPSWYTAAISSAISPKPSQES